ncbi:MAG: hypothetical protein R2851_16090 [Caldilineaceae bacterium]
MALHPTATARTPETFLWADVIPLHLAPSNGNGHIPLETLGIPVRAAADAGSRRHETCAIRRNHPRPQSQGHAAGGPIRIGEGRMAEQMVQVAYNAQHLAVALARAHSTWSPKASAWASSCC